jgi:hypothetical protein
MSSELDKLVKNIQVHVQGAGTDNDQGPGKMSLAKKKETLYNIYLEMMKIKDRKAITVKQNIIEPLLFSICEIG